MARFYLATLGCRLNEAENASWARELVQMGHQLVDTPDTAQVLVLNTCAVTQEASRKSRHLARRLHRSNPTAKLVLTGCFAALEPKQVAELEVDMVVGNLDKSSLVERLVSELGLETMPELASTPDAVHLFAQRRTTRAFVKVQDGCRNRCTYCIVTVARGAERSRTVEDVLNEIKTLEDSGHQEVVLTGVHLGGYGHDLGTNLSTLVQRVLRETSFPRLRLSSIEPWTLPDDFADLWSDSRLCPHLHLPLQSGCNSVLKRMARRCTVETFRETAAQLRERIPDLMLTTDLIVGFPGETDAEFDTSLEFLEEMRFSHTHIFAFSPREGTRAATMSEQLERSVKRERSQRAHEVATRVKEAILNESLGRRRSVLWEGHPHELTADPERVAWFGYSDHYLRVETHAPRGLDLWNVITDTTFSQQVDGEHLLGTELNWNQRGTPRTVLAPLISEA
ncbi:MAG: tRNA (N(6)-L-threonylcarbamoyladenosine(37)-C(2))-methylthiotransferase MtaB [Deltaproteobacteria bacterium CG2_30_63_29]|nr:MAG: tRNA (N(6)-L-threonylcarbamoyladenosine(37)-C(2))-methylthiotransferase MtaB [Deltaproteobacteria bacterium CG2_30_63_29]PIW01060.1 MAG: tRNA (N(6)-L-threonylcarbamoyladenosine(37)-C(2))-methylthiotransferase MtaB [Deltaproteobacteria bacterium CG17_big_fil_post_rev_8_21_14_2_50_63_7]PJB41183.1 MAG: tRNA (N(6)-L-threonylcarbamoyladenosine(37)-C(2))-methylthiotransferase MtaB [Deltaproteobacteria bacterium CG_4_9_14_3_um_filter_63_12]